MARLLERQGKGLLCKEGIPVPRGTVVASLEEALKTAQYLGYPLAVKAQFRGGG